MSEVEDQDDHKRTCIAFVGVGSNKRMIEQQLQQVLRLIEAVAEFEIYDSDITFV